jgi:DNA-directed RNA polymerase specialized sigma24 family protein
MLPGVSVSQWLSQLQEGNAEAAQKLWERYFQRLVGLARKRLGAMPRRAADEEDVALSAFNSFCRGAEQGRFPQLKDRDNLWALLVTITARKAFRFTAKENRQKRGGSAVLDEAALESAAGAGANPRTLDELLDREPTPAFAAQVAEEFQRLLDCLPDEDLRRVAQWKMEAYTNEEIADKLGYAVRSIERKLRLIRSLWHRDDPG